MVPVPADYNGDGKVDLAVYQRHTGNWYIRTLGGNKVLAFGVNWGDTNMDPVVGDYNGDGRADLAVYQRKTGNWFIRSLNGGLLSFGQNWGWNATQPVPGDFDGDGRDDLAVYHRATGNWFIRRWNGAAIVVSQNWGLPGGSTPTQTYVHRGTAGQTFICFGDSVTFGRGSSTNGPASGYPKLLERKLEIQFGGLFRCLNFGVPGEFTSGGRARVTSVLNSVPYADGFILMQGTNDALTDEIFATTDNNLRDMLAIASNRGLTTFLSTVPPVLPQGASRAAQASRVQSFNSFIPSIAQPSGSRVVDTYSALASRPNLSAFYDSANHPNDRGYQVVRDAYFRAIRSWILTGF